MVRGAVAAAPPDEGAEGGGIEAEPADGDAEGEEGVISESGEEITDTAEVVRSKTDAVKMRAWGAGAGGGDADAALRKKLVEAKAKKAIEKEVDGKKYKSYVVKGWEKAALDVSELDMEDASPEEAARMVMERIGTGVEERMAKMFEKAKTAECRALIGEHFGYFVNAMGVEVSMPFSEEQFANECDEEKYDLDYLPEGISIGDVQNRTYQPPRDEAEYLENPDDLRLLYAVLTHNDADATIRLIEALHEDGYIFVVHVDGKEIFDHVYDALAAYASTRDHVHVLSHPHRVRVNWGGFSMVNATLQILHYAFALDGSSNDSGPLEFHKFVHISSTTYPIRSNTEIRRRIASYPLDANFLNVVFKPNDPGPGAWNYFVECDDALHRIYRLTPLTEDNYGIDIYTSSQWFIISREFAEYIALAEPGTLVHDYLEYVEHVVVADESFFGTVLRHTQYCGKHHNDNFLHLQFDRWENELETGEKDPRKCVMANPEHCGRSPTTMTMDYLPNLELSGSLFARKFLDHVDSQVKDVIDTIRAREEELFQNKTDDSAVHMGPDTSFEGHGVLIVAKETVNETVPLCLGLGEAKNMVRLVPCFHDGVPEILAPTWETGAVIEEETLMHNRWNVGPCSSDGNLERLETAELKSTPGAHSETGPSCLIIQMDGLRTGRCIDSESDRLQPGGKVHVFPCIKRWNQFFSFGNGIAAPQGSIHTTVPRHIKKRIDDGRGEKQDLYLCLGVMGRTEMNYTEWEEDKEKENLVEDPDVNPDEMSEDGEKMPLSRWSGKQLVALPCKHADAVIEWLYVPYIVEEGDSGEPAAETEEAEPQNGETSDTASQVTEDEEEDEL